jgi:DHA3 family tetracycline resistance protein-like MFS transporter
MSTGRRLAVLEPLRIRDFRLLWTGMTVSLLGDGVFLVAIAWQVYQLSNAPTALAEVGLAMSLSQVVVLLVGGVASDRFDRRRVMLAADLLRAAAIGLLSLLALTGRLQLWHLFVLATLYGLGAGFFGPAFDAIVPDLVPQDVLAPANSVDQILRPVALRLAGPALGGWLIGAWGTGGAFLFDAASFLISAAMVGRMAPQFRPVAGAVPTSAVGEIREGFGFVRRHVWLWGTFLAATFAYLLFAGPTEVLVPFIVKHQLAGSAGELGLVFAVGGLGAVTGAFLVGQRGNPRRYISFMYVSWALATLAVAGYGLATRAWQLMLASLVFNGLEAAGTVVWATTKHRLVPTALLGRVSSLDWFISIGLLPVSFAITGPVAAAVGPRATLIGAGLLGAAVTLGGLFLPGMRSIERGELPMGLASERVPSGGPPAAREPTGPRGDQEAIAPASGPAPSGPPAAREPTGPRGDQEPIGPASGPAPSGGHSRGQATSGVGALGGDLP